MTRLIRLSLIASISLMATACATKAPSRAEAVAELTAALETPNPSVQVPALLHLSELGQEAQAATPAVLPLLKSKDRSVRRHAALALGRVAPPDQAVAPLTAALKDPDADVRRQAAISLGVLGPLAQSALPDLEKVSKEPDPCGTTAIAISNIRR